MQVQGVRLDDKKPVYKKNIIKRKSWAYLSTARYKDSLDREFGKEKRNRTNKPHKKPRRTQ